MTWLGRRWWRARLKLLQRGQQTSLVLRSEFRQRYRLDIGLHSYGCFDPERIRGPAVIGRYCSFSDTARIVDANHPMSALSTHPAFYDPAFGVVPHQAVEGRLLRMEDDVWVGHNAVILPGCRYVGRGAVIGAGAVVTHDVAPFSIVAGVPARKLADRFAPETVDRIQASRWWEREPADLRKLARDSPDFFFRPGAGTEEGL